MPLARQPVLDREARQLHRIRFGSPEWMIQNGARGTAEVQTVHAQRGPESASRVARGWRDQDARKAALAQDARVRAAVQRDAASETQVGKPYLFVQPPRHIDERLLEDALHRRGDVRVMAAGFALRIDRVPRIARGTERVDESARVRAARGEVVVEIREIERESAVRGAAEHLADFVRESRAAVRSQPHHLVLALVHWKSEPGREGRVEHAERVREANLAQHLELGAAVVAHCASPDGERRPFADAVRGEDRGLARRRGQKGRRGVRLVVLGEEDLAPANPELRRDDPLDPQLLAQGALHRARKAAPGPREPAERHREDPPELQHRLFVEDDRVEIGRLDSAPFEAPLDGGERKRRVVLPARKALLLHGANGNAVDDQRGRRVVVVRRDPQDAHQYWLENAAERRAGMNPSGSRRAARRASNANGGSTTKYCRRRNSVPRTDASAAATRRYAFQSRPMRACHKRARDLRGATRSSCVWV